MIRPTTADLARLRAKYEEMIRLRELQPDVDPRRALVALAGEFPGALREIDDLALEEIHARIAALARAEREPGAVLPWMRAMWRFHILLRGALAAKKWLAGRRVVSGAEAAAFEREAADLEWGDDAREWGADLSGLASPPRGRLTDLVFARLAPELELDPDAVRALVFGVPRRARRGIT